MHEYIKEYVNWAGLPFGSEVLFLQITLSPIVYILYRVIGLKQRIVVFSHVKPAPRPPYRCTNYWVPQKLPQIYAVIAYICIVKVA